jgi:hypothetical protein
MIPRGMAGVNLMNYSILQSELEQETGSLEDMHMFFVAFNQRQNKLLQHLERADMVQKANDRANLLFIDEELGQQSPELIKEAHNTDTSAPPESGKMNVIWLKSEVDLE